jgi:hypothetical protein
VSTEAFASPNSHLRSSRRWFILRHLNQQARASWEAIPRLLALSERPEVVCARRFVVRVDVQTSHGVLPEDEETGPMAGAPTSLAFSHGSATVGATQHRSVEVKPADICWRRPCCTARACNPATPRYSAGPASHSTAPSRLWTLAPSPSRRRRSSAKSQMHGTAVSGCSRADLGRIG